MPRSTPQSDHPQCEADLATPDEPRLHRHQVARRRHRHRSQGRSGPDRGRAVPDARDVRRGPRPGEEGLRLCLGRRGRHRADPQRAARNQPVTFTVDAYPKDTFTGQIAQVRLNPTTVSNVVTYTVVVEINSDLKLLPGMTANLAFQIEKRTACSPCPMRPCDSVPSRSRSEERPGDREGRRKTMPTATPRQAGQQKEPATRRRGRKPTYVSVGTAIGSPRSKLSPVSPTRSNGILSGDWLMARKWSRQQKDPA